MLISLIVGDISYNFNNKDQVLTGLNNVLLNSIDTINLLYTSWYWKFGPLSKVVLCSLEDSKSRNSFYF